MNDQDKEALKKWYTEEYAKIIWDEFNGDEIVEHTWLEACRYKERSLRDGSRMKQMNDEIESLKDKLKAERNDVLYMDRKCSRLKEINEGLISLIKDLAHNGMDYDIATRIEKLEEL